MPLEDLSAEVEPLVLSKEYRIEVPVVELDAYGNCSVHYVPTTFKTEEFYGSSHRTS